MRIYRELTGLADAVERTASERDAADDISSQMLLRRFNLGDQDLVKLDKYLRSAMRSDGDNQAKLLAEICSRKAGFQTLDEFGIALNEFRDLQTEIARFCNQAR